MLDGVKNTILFGLLIFNLSGCVGFYETKSSGPVEKDMTLALMVVPQDERKLWKSGKPQILKQAEFVNDERSFPLGAIAVGRKDQKQDKIIKEVKIYNDKTRWCGRTIWAIFPIPLLSPSCRTYTELTFENGEPISAREQYLEKTGRICGPFVPMMKISNTPLPDGFCGEIGEIE